MGERSPQVDAYIAAAPDFAAPILIRFRDALHAACPDVEEAIKWRAPHFLYRGKLFSHMAAFQQHCAFGFWHSDMAAEKSDRGARGQFGRVTSIKELPPAAELKRLIRRAMQLADDGVKSTRVRQKKPPLTVPKELQAALLRNAKARAAFAALSPSHQREYCDWIREAKRDETRERRILTTLEWVTEGKPRHWKYGGRD